MQANMIGTHGIFKVNLWCYSYSTNTVTWLFSIKYWIRTSWIFLKVHMETRRIFVSLDQNVNFLPSTIVLQITDSFNHQLFLKTKKRSTWLYLLETSNKEGYQEVSILFITRRQTRINFHFCHRATLVRCFTWIKSILNRM